jgi:hypothetical protein
LRQIVNLSVNLETGSRPIKVRHIEIDTHADPEGYMDAQLSISAFKIIEAKKETTPEPKEKETKERNK